MQNGKVKTFLRHSWLRSQASSLVATGTDFSVTWLLTEVAGLWYAWSNAAGASCGAVTSFLLGRNWAFSQSVGRNPSFGQVPFGENQRFSPKTTSRERLRENKKTNFFYFPSTSLHRFFFRETPDSLEKDASRKLPNWLNSRDWHFQALRYALASGLSLVLNTAGVVLLTEAFGMPYLLSKTIIAIFIGLTINYLLFRYFVFR